jgi:APA family basic amino acid/polyamine antiporter
VVQSLRTSLVNTGIGVAIMVAGVPVYFIWKHLFRAVRT